MSVKRILVLGGGFAGLWSAVGAARKLDELGYGPNTAEVTLVNRDAFHNIRVRNYEADLTAVRVPLDDVLGPIGVQRVEGEVVSIDLPGQTVAVTTASGPQVLPYDRLVCALGSQLLPPNVPGLAAHGFDVDTYDGAARLNAHLQSRPRPIRHGHAASSWLTITRGSAQTWENSPGRSSRRPSPRWGSRHGWVSTSPRSVLPV